MKPREGGIEGGTSKQQQHAARGWDVRRLRWQLRGSDAVMTARLAVRLSTTVLSIRSLLREVFMHIDRRATPRTVLSVRCGWCVAPRLIEQYFGMYRLQL